MSAQDFDWLAKTRAMLLRFRDESKAAYVGIKMKHGAAAAAHIMEEVGAAMAPAIKRLDEYQKTKTIPGAPPTADEDDFG